MAKKTTKKPAKKTAKPKAKKAADRAPLKNPNAWAIFELLKKKRGPAKFVELRHVLGDLSYEQFEQGIGLLVTWKIARMWQDPKATEGELARGVREPWARRTNTHAELLPRAQWQRLPVDPVGKEWRKQYAKAALQPSGLPYDPEASLTQNLRNAGFGHRPPNVHANQRIGRDVFELSTGKLVRENSRAEDTDAWLRKKLGFKVAKKAAKPKAKKAAKRPRKHKLELAKKGPEIIRRRAPKLVSPRVFLKQARAQRRAELAEVRTTCKAGRAAVKARYRARFEKLKGAFVRSLDRAELEHQRDCKARKDAIDSVFRSKAERAAQHKAERKRAAEHRGLLVVKRRTTAKQIKALDRARESRREQLDRARYEVETQAPNMLPLFDRVKERLKLRAGFTSLAEVFFQFAHDHPEEVIASAQSRANKAAAAEIRAMSKGTKFERVSGAICNKAERAYKSGRAFHLKHREEAALRAIGADPDRLMATCYPRRRRVVSGREYRGTSKASEAPF